MLTTGDVAMKAVETNMELQGFGIQYCNQIPRLYRIILATWDSPAAGVDNLEVPHPVNTVVETVEQPEPILQEPVVKYPETDKDLSKLLTSEKLSIAVFSASWCGPCQKLKPLFMQLPTEFPNVSEKPPSQC